MDFEPTESERTLCEALIRFAQSELNESFLARDSQSAFDRSLWLKCAAQGVLGLFVPETLGGSGMDTRGTILALESFGYGCRDNGLSLALNGQMWSVQEPLLRFGSEAQKTKYLPKLCHGEMLAAHGMTEAEAGSDAFSLSTKAVKQGNHYVIDGQKHLIGLAPVCDLALVFAATNPGAGKWGISAFLVETDLPGVTRGANCDKMGLRTAPLGGLTFENCRVPVENRLGPEGAGLSIFNNSMLWERSFIFASHVGAMRRQLEEASLYAQTRQTFGEAIVSYQAVSNRLADMRVRLELSQLLLYKLAWMKDTGRQAHQEAAIAKTYISEAYVESSLDAVRIHGGKGYLSEYGVEQHLRDATGGVIYSGTNEIQMNLIAGLEGLS